MAGIDFLLLGSGGWIPTYARETCCAYLRHDRRVLLIDAGTGVQRLVDEPALLEGVDGLDILLTHFHLDHVVGLSYLPALGLDGRTRVWGPGRRLYGVDTAEILARLLGRPLFTAPLEQTSEVLEIGSDPFEAAGLSVASRVQHRHADPTLALRIEDSLTYCTDTALDLQNADFAGGSRVLLHEAWLAEDTSEDAGHTAAGDAGRLAATAGVEELVLIHVNPLERDEDALGACAQARFPASTVGRDLMRVPLA